MNLSIRRLLLLILISASSLVAQRSNQGMGPLLDKAEIKPGDTIPSDLSLYREDGSKVTLTEVVGDKHTVIVSGCLTCPIFHRTYSGVEAVYEDYKTNDKVQFFFMYKSLAHPELNGYVQPVTLEERLTHVKEAQRVLGTRIPWLSDGMDNKVRHTLGFGPNTQIVVDPDGKVVHALGWSDAEVLRRQLVSMVGDSETHTKVADLMLDKRKPFRQQRAYAAGVVQKPQFSSELTAIKMVASSTSKAPLYVKPRIEVDQGVLTTGQGEMYLGFFLDPIHGVHWNNLAAPLQYELKLPDGSVISPAKASAPEVQQESDGDPREFKLEVASLGEDKTAELLIHYFACSKEEGWCIPVTQSYTISFERDRDGGGTNGRSFRVGGENQNPRQRGGRSGQGGGNQTAGQMKERLMEMDANNDGKIAKDEAPEGMAQRFDQMDLNEDGLLDEKEIDEMVNRRGQGQQGGPGQERARGPGGQAGQGGRGQAGPRGAGGPGGAAGGQRGGGQFDPVALKARILSSDTNGDGKLAKEELPAQMQRRFEQMDANDDGFADESEIDQMLKNAPTRGAPDNAEVGDYPRLIDRKD